MPPLAIWKRVTKENLQKLSFISWMQMPQEANAHLKVQKQEVNLNDGDGMQVSCQLRNRHKVRTTFKILKAVLIMWRF